MREREQRVLIRDNQTITRLLHRYTSTTKERGVTQKPIKVDAFDLTIKVVCTELLIAEKLKELCEEQKT